MRSFPSLRAHTSESSPGGLRVLIATEEIIGPVRNGGIASTYYHLARGLAAQGYEVTVLYLKGAVVENETPDHWIEHYRQFGIDLVYLPHFEEKIAAASISWQERWFAFYRWLKANDRFHVVHSSEWRGGAFYCLQAKRMGLAFHDTLFITKTSSPHVWNRHYQMRLIEKHDLLVASFAEQKCVEWADIVVGGSAHLLSFMDHIGYRLPEGRTYVQPNIVDFTEVKVEDKRPAREFGDVVKSRELVFFGRLEPRKGIELFVYAVDTMIARGVKIDRVTFLGKEGERLSSQGNIKPLEFIEERAERWPFPVDISTDKNQPEALSFLCSRDMVVAMPSLIENSTMAVYEALVHKIPFVATHLGGTPELILTEDHSKTLVEPNVQDLAERLSAILEDGQIIARPAFDNDENLETWYGFHRYIAAHGHAELSRSPADADGEQTIAYICAPSDSTALEQVVKSLDAHPESVKPVLCIAFPTDESDTLLIEDARAKGAMVIEATGSSLGDCFNRAYAETDAELCVFCGTDAVVPEPGFYKAINQALTERPKDFVTSAFRIASEGAETDTLFMPLGGDIAAQLLTRAAYGLELVAGRRAAFGDIGPFEDYRVAAGTVYEFLTRTAVEGRELFVIPEPLLKFSGSYEAITKTDANCDYLVRKKILENTNIAVRKLLMMKSDRSGPQKLKNSGQLIMAGAHRAPNENAWLTNVERQGRLDDEVRVNHAIFVGFDRRHGILRVAIRHTGGLVVLLNEKAIRREEEFDSHGEIEILEFSALDFLKSRPKAHLRIELIGEPIRAVGIAIQRLEEGIYYLSSHRPIYWNSDFDGVLKMVEEMRAERLRELGGKSKTNGKTHPKTADGAPSDPASAANDLPGNPGRFSRIRRRLGL